MSFTIDDTKYARYTYTKEGEQSEETMPLSMPVVIADGRSYIAADDAVMLFALVFDVDANTGDVYVNTVAYAENQAVRDELSETSEEMGKVVLGKHFDKKGNLKRESVQYIMFLNAADWMEMSYDERQTAAYLFFCLWEMYEGKELDWDYEWLCDKIDEWVWYSDEWQWVHEIACWWYDTLPVPSLCLTSV